MTRLRLAIGSTASRPGDLAGNLAQIAGLARDAGALGCRALLTPEMSATGYGPYPEVLAWAEEPGRGPVYDGLARIARETGVEVLAGFVARVGQKRHIAHCRVRPDGTFQHQLKHRATPVEAPLDPAVPLVYDGSEAVGHVVPGTESFTVWIIGGVRCAAVICADWGLRGLHDTLDGLGVQLALLPTGAGGLRQDRVTDEDLASEDGRARYARLVDERAYTGEGALECRRRNRALAAVNQCGWDGQRFWHGGSGSILSAQGDVAAVIPQSPNVSRALPRLAFADLEFA